MSHRILLLLLMLLCSFTQVNAQKYLSPKGLVAFTEVDTMPYPGYNLYRYLSIRMKYPDEALVELAEGKVMIRFMVGKDGYLRNIEAIDTVGVHEALVKEAIRVVSRMPPWEPGINNGVSVDAYCALPINFKINNGWLQRKGIQNDAKKAIRKKARQKRINEEYGIYED